MIPQKNEFCDYLLKQLEKKDQQIYDLQYELELLLSTDDEFLKEASHRIDELKQKCQELMEALKTSLEYLERGPLRITPNQNPRDTENMGRLNGVTLETLKSNLG